MSTSAQKFIVQRGSADEFTFAIVDAVIRGSRIGNNVFFERLSRAVTSWVRDTEEGKAWYRGTSGDANIGDLDAYGIAAELRARLRDEGIVGLSIECHCHSTCVNWTYDTHLVNEGDLEPDDG